MLTDDEIMAIRNRAKLNDNRQIDPVAFAREIERAVLAKAGEQEPVGFIKQDLTPFLYYKDSLKLNPDDFLYAHPLPAQAIPEGWREMITDLANELESEVMAKYTLETLKYPSQKNKFDSDMHSVNRARALLSASPKPQWRNR